MKSASTHNVVEQIKSAIKKHPAGSLLWVEALAGNTYGGVNLSEVQIRNRASTFGKYLCRMAYAGALEKISAKCYVCHDHGLLDQFSRWDDLKDFVAPTTVCQEQLEPDSGETVNTQPHTDPPEDLETKYLELLKANSWVMAECLRLQEQNLELQILVQGLREEIRSINPPAINTPVQITMGGLTARRRDNGGKQANPRD